METSGKQQSAQVPASPATTLRALRLDALASNQELDSAPLPDRHPEELQDLAPKGIIQTGAHYEAFNRDILDGHTEGKISHDSGVSQSTGHSTASGATTPTSMTSMDASSDLFHATTLKVHGRDAEALNRARQAFSSTDLGLDYREEENSSKTSAVPAPLSAPIPSSPPSGPIHQSRMPVGLALRPVAPGTSSGKDIPPSRNSPLRQSTTFQQEQLGLLNIGHSKKEGVEMLLSPLEGQSSIPRSNSLPTGFNRASATYLPASHGQYADANEAMPHNIEQAAFSIGRPPAGRLPVPPGISRSNSTSDGLTEATSLRGADYVIAVVGASRVGKTTIISKAFKAWGLSEPVSLNPEGHAMAPQVNRYTASVDTGQPPRKRRVEIVEIDIQALRSPYATVETPSVWPSTLSRVDGVMVCYDATNIDSVAGLPEIVRDLCHQLPAMVIACKSDPDPDIELAIKPIEGNEIGSPYGIGLVELSVLVQQGRHKMRHSFAWMLKSISKQRRNRPQSASQRSPSLASPSARAEAPEAHALAPESEFLQAYPPHYRAIGPSTTRGLANAHTMPISTRSMSDGALAKTLADRGHRQSVTLLNTESDDRFADTDPETPRTSTGVPDAGGEAVKHKRTPSMSSRFATLQDLLERLSTAILGGTDNAFVNTFFLSYRRFCEPPQVLSYLLERWYEILGSTGMARQYLLWCQMRMVITMAEWLEVYPGDFAVPDARNLVIRFYASANQQSHLAHVAADIAIALQSIHDVNDLDESWSLAAVRAKTAPAVPSSRPEFPNPHASAISHASENSDIQSAYSDLDETTLEAIMASQKLESPREMSPITAQSDFEPSSQGHSRRQSTGSRVSLLSPTGSSPSDGVIVNGSTMTRTATMTTNPSLHRVDTNASRQTRASSDVSRSISELDSVEGKIFQKPLALFYELSDLAIAVELCREEWQIFSAVRPRDCFRQVLGGERETPASLSARHFNTISSWVSTMVLGPAKAKYRAQVYEKFCGALTQLIKLRNYSSTWAVASGLNDFSIRRLASTMALVRPAAKRELADALRLIDSTGSYKTYREFLKRDCDLGSKAIPFLGVVTQDLTKIHAAHSQDQESEDRIHWSKYSVMAEAIAPLALYQARGDIVAGLAQSGGAQYLIADTPLLDEEGLYRRSKHLEPDSRPGNTAVAPSASSSATGIRFKRLMAETMFGSGQ